MKLEQNVVTYVTLRETATTPSTLEVNFNPHSFERYYRTFFTSYLCPWFLYVKMRAVSHATIILLYKAFCPTCNKSENKIQN